MQLFLARKRIREAIEDNSLALDLNSDKVEKLTPADLEELMPEILKLRKLQKLYLKGHRITDISALGALRYLKTLWLNQNRISDISALRHLVKLEVLRLDENQINDVSALRALKRLEILWLSGNRIKNISALAGLTNLTYLQLYKNEVKDISALESLTKLEELNLSENKISNISSLVSLENLKFLDLSRNQAVEDKLPAEILEDFRNPHGIINYWLEIKGETRPLNEAKIVVIGEADIGKTFLINKLVHKKVVNTTSTHGIQIHRWPDVQVSNEKVQLNVWDFGGQEMMHSTHQFFFTKRTVYILVLDARKNEDSNKIEEWLKRIESLSGDSPVIIAGNQIDENKRNLHESEVGRFDINERGLLDKYSNIKGFYPLCCDPRKVKDEEEKKKYQELFEDFEKGLITEIGKLEEIHKPFPQSWFTIKDQLQAMKDQKVPFIEYHEYLTRCVKADIEDKTSQETIVNFLNEVGTVIYFKETDKDTMVFNPEWITKGVYGIIDSNFMKEKNGILRREYLADLLDSKEYPSDRHDFIIKMMRRFELCVDIEQDHVFLIPDLLTPNQPTEIRDDDWKGALSFQYHYETYLPSIITRFIVKMYGYEHQGQYWKSGIVLKYEDSLALVKAERMDKKLLISIKGNNQRNNQHFLSVIRKELKEVHDKYAELGITEKVPHPKYSEILKDYDELILAEEMDDETILVKELRKKLPIREFLDGIVSKEQRQQDLETQKVGNIINIYGNDATIVQDSRNVAIRIEKLDAKLEKRLDKLFDTFNEAENQRMEKFMQDVFILIKKNVSELSPAEESEIAEAETGKWETKLKTIIPIIPKLPWIGEFFPSMSVETTRTIRKNEFVAGVQKFYEEMPEMNPLQLEGKR